MIFPVCPVALTKNALFIERIQKCFVPPTNFENLIRNENNSHFVC